MTQEQYDALMARLDSIERRLAADTMAPPVYQDTTGCPMPTLRWDVLPTLMHPGGVRVEYN